MSAVFATVISLFELFDTNTKFSDRNATNKLAVTELIELLGLPSYIFTQKMLQQYVNRIGNVIKS